jgi:hypothetical protein
VKAALYCLIVLLCLIVGGAIGEQIGHRLGEPYDHSEDSFEVWRESGDEINGASVGVLLGLGASVVIITWRRRDDDE